MLNKWFAYYLSHPVTMLWFTLKNFQELKKYSAEELMLLNCGVGEGS